MLCENKMWIIILPEPGSGGGRTKGFHICEIWGKQYEGGSYTRHPNLAFPSNQGSAHGPTALEQESQSFFSKESVSIFDFVDHMVANTQVCHSSAKATLGNMQMNESGCVLIKLYKH